MIFAAALLAVAPCYAVQGETHVRSEEMFEVGISRVDGDLICDVRARRASVRLLVQAIARELDYEVDGFEVIGVLEPVTVQLTHRPLTFVLMTILGSVGLNASIVSDTITVRRETSAFASREEFSDLSQASYLRAVREYPTHPLAAHAEFRLAELQERRGNWSAAQARYEYLIENYPNAELMPEAMYRSAIALERLGSWKDAASRFRALGDLPKPHFFLTAARVEFARCSLELDKSSQALLLLQSMEQTDPPLDSESRLDRQLLRARALTNIGEPVDALRVLAGLDYDGTTGLRAMRIRGEAFELTGEIGRAALAWLEFSTRCGEDQRLIALRESARLSRAAGDYVGVLFIVARAQGLGLGDEFKAVESAAREALGLAPSSLGPKGRDATLNEARRHAEEGLFSEGRIVIERVLDSYGDQVPIDVSRLYVRLLDGEGRVEVAVTWLRSQVTSSDEADRRRDLFVLAAELFERNNNFDRAVDAYGGRL